MDRNEEMRRVAQLAELVEMPVDHARQLTHGDLELIAWARAPEPRQVDMPPELRDALRALSD